MRQDIKEKWISALRSGEYKKTIHTLRDTTGFCCLGVLCDIVKDDLGIEWERDKGAVYSFFGEFNILPNCVREYAELNGGNPEVFLKERSTSLASLNDNYYTFSQISDIIQEYF